MSGSPRSEQFDDIYFAVEDGLEETKHVFLAGNGLPDRWKEKKDFVIAETGFGTGLNFLSVWQNFEEFADPGQTLYYISFEKYPLSAGQIKEYLSVWQDKIGRSLDRLVDMYPLRVTGWHKIQVTDRVTLLLIFDDVNRAIPELDAKVDAWFLDGHAPAKNPDMWSEVVFKNIGRLSGSETTFATFTAAGFVKRGLGEAGFEVSKRRGFGRKRDMLTGVFKKETAGQTNARVSSIAVIGGGLAGTSAAHALKLKGYHVDLYEKQEIAAGASGNARGLFNPRFTAQKGVDSDFYGSAYALAYRTFNSLQGIGYMASGSLHLVTDDDKKKRFESLLNNWGWHNDHVRMLGPDEASSVSGVKIERDALFLPDAGSVNPALVCRQLVSGVRVHHETVPSLERKDDKWSVNDRVYDAVVIANGVECLAYAQLKDMPLHTVRGQITYAPATEETQRLKTNLCYGGYCSVAVDGGHAIGSTFQPWLTETAVREEDHVQILGQLAENIPALEGKFVSEGGRAALRTASKDRFPVGGKVPGHEGLYISTAHGSHGLLSSLMVAEVIAADISGTPQVLPRSVIEKLSPARFFRARG